MIEEIHFTSHVVKGIYTIIHNVIWYNYTYSNNFIRIIVQISLTILIVAQILVCQVLENGNIYKVENFRVY